MSSTTYEEKAKGFDEARDVLLRADIDAVRGGKDLRAFEKKRKVASIIREDLLSRGQFIRTREGELYYFDRNEKSLSQLDEDGFRATVHARYGLNATEDEARFVEADLLTHARTHGDRVEVRRLSYWDTKNHLLYLDAHDGTVFMLDGRRIDRWDNGQHGVLFRSDRRAESIEPDWPDDRAPFHELFAGLNLVGEQRHALALLKIWFVSIFFATLLPVRPVVLLVAPKGAGKTSSGRRLGYFLYGGDFEVGSFRSDATGEQDFLAAITAKTFLVFDNADARLPWLPDHLAKVATGAEIERRKLYTTNTLITFRPDCFLVLTARETPWKRDDLASRLLPIRLDTIAGAKLSERLLREIVLEERPRIWGAMLQILNDIVAALRGHGHSGTSHHRLADFHCFGRVAARVVGIESDFEEAMAALETQQFAFLAEGDERLELFRMWIDRKSDGWTVTISSADLFSELRKRYTGVDRDFPFRSTTAIGTWIGKNKDLLAHTLGLIVSVQHTRRSNLWTFLKVLPKEGSTGSQNSKCAKSPDDSPREKVKPSLGRPSEGVHDGVERTKRPEDTSRGRIKEPSARLRERLKDKEFNDMWRRAKLRTPTK